ncbi:beta-ketoacyl synthase N-terminal-like domain-containing protein [Actinoalloteichus hymeniacidonis]|uniref:3-oxoacyl-(Acyl-carrier-protein) synthase n=1 Tax=Actinoalloteichus hymeniacidonis TaxID=340345 RepID=A0AAC9N0H2_9PSEU|nr:beta-ketoacyl synthase N-terminal-like domain-containing protein [Actinoalloteichus hymeniacidonis]AOS65594.1 3-oxoacyl-(acyl-carrier-protein) synthase [Actinoalloteichus hymeniacidonis]MBB5906316.1 3-oxoacyl-[acyl-carrier-protein] synthase II [Actinoalloteichus hymeniacidonis]
MTAASTVEPLTITACSAVSAAGFGIEVLGDRLRTADRATASAVEGTSAERSTEEDFPPRPVRTIADLRVAEFLGRRGTRNLDRLTLLGLITAKQLLDETGPVAEDDQPDVGVAIGTAAGSLRTQAEIGRDTLIEEKPYLVNPSRFPNTVMNSCAGQIAIRNSLQGVNATLAAGQLSSLHALRYARVAIGRKRAGRLLVGGVEELSPQLAWGWHRTSVVPSDVPLGEGAALLMVSEVEQDRDSAIAQLLACEVGFAAPGSRTIPTRVLRTLLDRALTRSGLTPDEVDVVSLGAVGSPTLRRVEERAVTEVLGERAERIRVADVVGECFSASGALQVAALLALWRREPAERPRVGVVTSVGPDGNLGCAVIREAA